MLCAVGFGAYGDGLQDGTSANPYLIGDESDWNTFAADSSEWSVGNKYFMLTADIDFNGVNIDPLPKATADFNGIFDVDIISANLHTSHSYCGECCEGYCKQC